jgi:hypothetical protein
MQLTIAGKTFQVEPKYEAGHSLSENEANALNQLRYENLRNNFAGKVKAGAEAGIDDDTLQSQLADYANSYEFGARAVRSAVIADPVLNEAIKIVKEKLMAAAKAKGYKPAEVREELAEKAESFIASRDTNEKAQRIWELAQERVSQKASIASDDLGDMLGERPASQEAPAKKARKSKGEQHASA